MRSKKKMFELLALKDRLERNNYYKQAKAISDEINKNNHLKEKLEEIVAQEKKTDNSMTALQLKSKKWYNLRIQEQILASENKKIFLEKENSQIQKKIAQKHHKMRNSLEKAAFHKKIDEENLDKKNQNSLPTLNKGSDN
tara:strand:+ start:200 stop:619 length:420 start_codon:yes stop_codon:yes gene_type:complete